MFPYFFIHSLFTDGSCGKGKSKQVSVFEVFDADPPAQKEAKLATKPLFESALLHYYTGALVEATQLWQQCLEKNQRDRVAQIYLQRCQQILAD